MLESQIFRVAPFVLLFFSRVDESSNLISNFVFFHLLLLLLLQEEEATKGTGPATPSRVLLKNGWYRDFNGATESFERVGEGLPSRGETVVRYISYGIAAWTACDGSFEVFQRLGFLGCTLSYTLVYPASHIFYLVFASGSNFFFFVTTLHFSN